MKKIIIGITALAVLAVAGWYVLSATKPAEEQMKGAFVNLLNSGKFRLKSTIVVKPATPQNGLNELRVNTDGDFEKNKDGSLNFASAVEASGIGEGTTISGKGEVRLIDKKLYYRINEMPPIIPDAEKIVGVWLPGGEGLSVLPNDVRANVSKAVKNQQVFQEVKKVGTESVNGASTSHIQARLSPEGYAAFAEEIAKQSGKNLPISKEQVQKNIESLGAIPFDAWIDRSGFFKRIKVTMTNPTTKNVTEVTLDFEKGNKAKIEAPKDVQGLGTQTSPTPETATPSPSPSK